MTTTQTRITEADWRKMTGRVDLDSKIRIQQIERTPKAQLARMHVANGGQMGLATYLKWQKRELVNAILEDEGLDPWA